MFSSMKSWKSTKQKTKIKKKKGKKRRRMKENINNKNWLLIFFLCMIMNACGVGLVHQAKQVEVCSTGSFHTCKVIDIFAWHADSLQEDIFQPACGQRSICWEPRAKRFSLLKPTVGQTATTHVLLTARDFFLANFYFPCPFIFRFSKTSPRFFLC